MSDKEKRYSESFGDNVESARPGSQSPQAIRGTAQDYEQFQKGEVQTNVASGSRSEGTDRGYDEFPGKENDESF